MSKKWFLWRALAALICVGLLIAGGLAIHYLSWSRGYAAGQLATPGEEGATLPYLPHGFDHSGHPFAFMFGAGLLFKILLLFLLFGVIGKVFRGFAWGMAGGPWLMGAHRASHWHRHHGPMPPWCWDWEKSSEETQTEPDVKTGDTEV